MRETLIFYNAQFGAVVFIMCFCLHALMVLVELKIGVCFFSIELLILYSFFTDGSSGYDCSSPISISPGALPRVGSAANIRRIPSTGIGTSGIVNVYSTMWRSLLELTLDPFPTVNQHAGIIVNSLKSKVSIMLY